MPERSSNRGVMPCTFSALLVACSSGGGGGDTSATETDGGSTSTAAGTTDATSGGTTGEPDPPPDPPTNPDCVGTASASPTGAPFDVQVVTFTQDDLPLTDPDPAQSELAMICPNRDLAVLSAGTTLYRPDVSGDWPSVRVPLIIFAHGVGQNAANYPYLFTELARRGFAVLAVEMGNPSGDVLGRQDSIACALSWIGWDHATRGGASIFDGHLTCDIALGGHSQGGLASWQLVRDRFDSDWAPYLFGFDVRALFSFGTRHDDDTLPAEDAVPMLLMVGALDEDTRLSAIEQYDLTPHEEDLGPAHPLRLAHIIDGASHNSFGGAAMISDPTSNAATAAAFDYVPRFLEWQVFAENVQENRRRLFLEEFSAALANPAQWAVVDGYGGLTGGPWCSNENDASQCADREGCTWFANQCIDLDCSDLGSPADCDVERGCAWDGGDAQCVDQETVAGLQCEGITNENDCNNDPSGDCAWEVRPAGCVDRPMVFADITLDTADPTTSRMPIATFPATPAGLEASAGLQWDVGLAETLINAASLHHATDHETSVVYAEWNGAETLTVPFIANGEAPLDLSAYSYLSVRLANLRQYPSDPASEAECEISQDPIPVGLRLLDDDPSPTEARRVVKLRPQDVAWGGGGLGTLCQGRQAMDTFRVPISAFCEPGLDMTRVAGLEFFFEDLGQSHNVFIDSIEFTANEYDDDPAQDGSDANLCPTMTAAWRCEADSVLAAAETTCLVEPTNGACSSTTSNAVALPHVEDGSQGYSGWVVHSPPGAIRTIGSPTSAELTWVESQCVAACIQEWANTPEIAANCSDSGAFLTPTLVESPNIGPTTAIADDRVDGNGIFVGESLGCDLQGNCCLAFDEQVCRAAPSRVTPAAYPLQTGQEYVIKLDPTLSELEVTGNGTTDSFALHGEVGFSTCRDGNGSAPCPFYLGWLFAKSFDQIVIPVTCPDSSVINRTLWNLEITLGQPAFGIAQQGTDLVGFPAGSLVFDATFKMNAQDKAVRGFTEVDIVGTASPTGFDFGQIEVIGMMPACWGQDDIPVQGTFSLVLDVSGGVLDSPPSITIDIPSTVSCSSSVDLDATVGDPDGDLDAVRWYVDDVLIDASITSLTFTEPHTVRAVAYDGRGAATTDTKVITCN